MYIAILIHAVEFHSYCIHVKYIIGVFHMTVFLKNVVSHYHYI
jgi:hypothetical protein